MQVRATSCRGGVSAAPATLLPPPLRARTDGYGSSSRLRASAPPFYTRPRGPSGVSALAGRKAEAAIPTPTPEQVQGAGAGRRNLGVGGGVEWMRAWVNADVSSRRRGASRRRAGARTRGARVSGGHLSLHARRDDDGVTRVWPRACCCFVFFFFCPVKCCSYTLHPHSRDQGGASRLPNEPKQRSQ